MSSEQHLVESTRRVKLDKVQTYDRNPRIGNVEAIAASLEANGQFKPIVVQKATNKILAGNHTYMAAKKLGWQEILVSFVDVDDDMAKRIVLADNRTADEGGYNDDVVAELLSEIMEATGDLDGMGFTSDETDWLLENMLDNVNDSYAPRTVGEELDDTDTILVGVQDLKDTVVFPSDDPFGIPELDPALIPHLDDLGHIEGWAGQDMAEEVEQPPDLWMYPCRDISTVGMPWEQTLMCFYTDDDRFDDTWDKPAEFTARLLNRKVPVAVEPDYSHWAGDPVAQLVWNMYRMRWLGRYWQEAGVKVIPNYQSGSDRRLAELSCAGIPHQAPCVAIGMYVTDAAHSGGMHLLAGVNHLVDIVDPQSLLVYGAVEEDGVPKTVIRNSAFTGPVQVVEPVVWKRRRVRKEKHGVTDMLKLS